jgi:hypothetical protein
VNTSAIYRQLQAAGPYIYVIAEGADAGKLIISNVPPEHLPAWAHPLVIWLASPREIDRVADSMP